MTKELLDKMDGFIRTSMPMPDGFPHYVDLPGRFTPDAWEWFQNLIGKDNLHELAVSEGRNKNGPWVRGQLALSDQGWKNLENYKRDRQKRRGEAA